MLNKNLKYLFVCQFGQSRSRWFAERFMEMGIKAVFCGWDSEADIKFNFPLIEWSDKIIVLDKDFETYNSIMDVDCLNFYIEDEPGNFEEHFDTLLEVLEE